MKLPDLIDLAARNLRNSRLRNGLTAAGIGVGIASLVAMLSLGVGLQELAGSRLSRSGLFNTVMVSEWRSVEQMRRDGQPSAEANSAVPLPDYDSPPVLDDTARQEILRLPGVMEAEPEIRFVGEIQQGDKALIAQLGGLPASAREDEAFDTLKGKFFSGPQAGEAIVRIEFAREWDAANPQSILGQEVVLRYAERESLAPANSESPADTDSSGANANSADDSANGSAFGGEESAEDSSYGFTVVRKEQALRVVGIVETQPYGGMRELSRARVFIPLGLAEKMNLLQSADLRGSVTTGGGRRTYSSLMTQVKSPARVGEVQDAVRRMGFRTFSILNASQSLRRFFAILDLFLAIFGSMALAVASLGIANTLVMAVLERRREIGIMKALGASDRDIKMLFFAEAGSLGLVGGLLGVAFGWAMSKGINLATEYYLRQRQLPPETVSSVPPWLVAVGIGFAIIVSLIAGLYPASRAAKLDPVQAIRYE
ncbi:MAG: ABC transporter permease [Acidobacteria bacterium]|nr:ABC transporter permease [Acidobacteriota bacterium]